MTEIPMSAQRIQSNGCNTCSELYPVETKLSEGL